MLTHASRHGDGVSQKERFFWVSRALRRQPVGATRAKRALDAHSLGIRLNAQAIVRLLDDLSILHSEQHRDSKFEDVPNVYAGARDGRRSGPIEFQGNLVAVRNEIAQVHTPIRKGSYSFLRGLA